MKESGLPGEDVYVAEFCRHNSMVSMSGKRLRLGKLPVGGMTGLAQRGWGDWESRGELLGQTLLRS